MVFSKVLYAINTVKLAQQQGHIPPQKYQIKLKEVAEDFNSMLLYYRTILPSIPQEAKQEFASEVYSFYLLVDKMHANENNLNEKDASILRQIYTETKKIKDKLPPPMVSEK